MDETRELSGHPYKGTITVKAQKGIQDIVKIVHVTSVVTFTFMHLADAFIQSDLQLHSGYTFSLVHVIPGNRTHNLLRC